MYCKRNCGAGNDRQKGRFRSSQNSLYSHISFRCVRAYACVRTCMCVCMHLCMRVSVYVCVYKHVYVYVHVACLTLCLIHTKAKQLLQPSAWTWGFEHQQVFLLCLSCPHKSTGKGIYTHKKPVSIPPPPNTSLTPWKLTVMAMFRSPWRSWFCLDRGQNKKPWNLSPLARPAAQHRQKNRVHWVSRYHIMHLKNACENSDTKHIWIQKQ